MSEETMTMKTALTSSSMRRNASVSVVAAGLALALLLLVAMIGAGRAEANSPVNFFTTTNSSTQAGGHPDVFVEFEAGNRWTQGNLDPCFCNDPKSVKVSLPAGVIGNPHVTPQCTTVDFANFECPKDSQVGVVAVLLFNTLEEGGLYFLSGLYNMEANPEQAGVLAFAAPLIANPIFVELSARTESDYGLNAETTGIERLIPIFRVHQFLWGVPANSIHDAQRFTPNGTQFSMQTSCSGDPIAELKENKSPCFGPSTPAVSDSPELPFMSNPTTCSGELTSTIDTVSFDHGTDHSEAPYPAVTGCDQLQFSPSLSAKPTTAETDTASGLDIDLNVPQFQSPTTPSPSQIKATTVTLPPGFSINPNAADGKQSCSDQEARLDTNQAAQCPEFSKVGTLTIESSALPGPLPGAIYLGDPRPGNRYRLILAANGFATHIKIVGSVTPDPATGQLVTSFPDLPQSPLTRFNMHFFGSERGLLATPTQCGTYPVHSTFTPWDGSLAEQNATQFFVLDSGPVGAPCPASPRPFNPRFSAASAQNTAGAHSLFSATLQRDDGDQNLTALSVTPPPGFAATLKGVPYCSESAIAAASAPGYTGQAELASPACPAGSQIGTAVAGTGAGTRPLYNGGKVYLAGPYKGAPLSLLVVLPAVAGPYDLGNVVVRAAIHVDPVTARVTAVSDPFPQILEGVVLRTRSVRIDLDRPNFTLNPTSCDPFSVDSQVHGDEGAVATPSDHFQVANCARLGFGPKLALRLRGSNKRRGHPALQAVYTSRDGEANLARTVVVMPKNELLDNSHIGAVCTRTQFAARSCPADSVYGSATVQTPLLDQPLSGPVYLRSSSHKLPDLVADLRGQIDIELSARIDSVKGGGLRARFEGVPDAPVTRFVLDMKGGTKGLLQNSRNLCPAGNRASVRMIGQNGKHTRSHPKLRTGCGSKASGHRRHLRWLHRSRAVR